MYTFNLMSRAPLANFTTIFFFMDSHIGRSLIFFLVAMTIMNEDSMNVIE